jgi:hypothetical protein
MKLLVEIIAGLAVALAIAVAVLRIRKVRRDSIRDISRSTDRRLMTPPPSPYASSKGFRLLDESGVPMSRPEPVRPRLEPDREYVFSDSQLPANDEPLGSSLRRNESWALSRSAHRPKVHVTTLRVAILAAIVLAILIIGGLLLGHFSPKAHSLTTTTTTSLSTTTTGSTTTTWPKTFNPSSTTAQSATYGVPANKYQVSVSGSLGPTWVKFVMGPASTLEWQGTVARNKSETLQLTGGSTITLGSPKNAAVTVGGSRVNFPAPLPATLTLHFVAATAPAG